MEKCSSCGQDIDFVSEQHENWGHNISCEYRYDLVQDDSLCEDCIDDILENM